MAKADVSECVVFGLRATQTNYHVKHATICICGKGYCLSCHRGCPRCGIGRDVDRRDSMRVTEPPIQVRIVSDGVA